MRFLATENLPRGMIEGLRLQGHDVVSVKESMRGADDTLVLDAAQAEATFENGLLQIKLVREIPEAMKPRRIPIGVAPDPQIEERRAA